MIAKLARIDRLSRPVQSLLATVFIFIPGARAHKNGELR